VHWGIQGSSGTAHAAHRVVAPIEVYSFRFGDPVAPRKRNHWDRWAQYPDNPSLKSVYVLNNRFSGRWLSAAVVLRPSMIKTFAFRRQVADRPEAGGAVVRTKRSFTCALGITCCHPILGSLGKRICTPSLGASIQSRRLPAPGAPAEYQA